MRSHRDIELPDDELRCPPGDARKCIAVIGIDQYRGCEQLSNAVNDAVGVLEAFETLGFERAVEPLLDEAATGDALDELVRTELRQKLSTDDSLVLFFAGHGLADPPNDDFVYPKGYLLPVDADPNRRRSWLEIASWLDDITALLPRHILVILDSCHSGIALSHDFKSRGHVPPSKPGLDVGLCRSRHVITSARHTERARDDGPVPGHSLFAGCLIDAVLGGLDAAPGESSVLVHSLAAHLEAQVRKRSGTRQNPLVGTLAGDEQGQLWIPVARRPKRGRKQPQRRGIAAPARAVGTSKANATATKSATNATNAAATKFATNATATNATVENTRRGADGVAGSAVRRITEPGDIPPPDAAPPGERSGPDPTPRLRAAPTARALGPDPDLKAAEDTASTAPSSTAPALAATRVASGAVIDDVLQRSEGWTLDPAFAAVLDRHGAARANGAQVLTVIAGEAMATRLAWATWAASRGYLTLATDGRGPEAAIVELLAQTPWLRCLPEARRRLAAAARIAIDGVDAALDGRSSRERSQWVRDVAPLDRHAQVSGWLLSALRERAASVPDLATAPVQGGELLAIACDLACPTAVLIQQVAPDAGWLEGALGTAAALTAYLPRRCVAVTAPGALVTAVLHGARRSVAQTMARQGLVTLMSPARRAAGRSVRRTARALLGALAQDRRTRGRFELDGQVTLGERGPALDVGLLARRARVVVELDGWHHFHDPEGYERDRIQDVRLSRAGYFVLRFLAEDVDDRLASTIEEIALALASRRTQGGFA